MRMHINGAILVSNFRSEIEFWTHISVIVIYSWRDKIHTTISPNSRFSIQFNLSFNELSRFFNKIPANIPPI